MYEYQLHFPSYYDQSRGMNKVAVIKAIRELTGYGLMEAKNISEQSPPFTLETAYGIGEPHRKVFADNNVRITSVSDSAPAMSLDELLKAAAKITLRDGDISKTIAILQLIG